jgi:hypothetical protein
VAAEKMHWESRPPYGGSETRLLVRDSDGRIMIELLHGQGPNEPWGVYKDGAGYGDYLTEDQAKAKGQQLIGWNP